jgi:hypothetical protein
MQLLPSRSCPLPISLLAVAVALHVSSREACGQEPTPTRPKSPEPASSTGAIVTGRGDTALKYQYVTRDSTGLFAPGGYYFPIDDVAARGIKLHWLQLQTVWFYYDGSLHFDRPRVFQPPLVLLTFEGAGGRAHRGSRCEGAVVTRDTLSISCTATAMGNFSIDGHLVAGRGRGARLTDAAALVARVVLRQNGRVVFDRVIHFRYFEGD